MESLHSTEAFGSENNPSALRNPATFHDFDSASSVLQSILKANLQDEVRSHVLCKFFEELGSLSREDISKFIVKIFSSGFNHSLDKTKDERISEVTQAAEDEAREVPSMANAPLTLATASFSPEMVDINQGETSYDNILSFLKEATACGALVLNDAESVFQCLNNVLYGKREAHMLTEKSGHAKGEKEYSEAPHLAGSSNKGDGLNERDKSLCPMVFDPMGKPPCAVSNASADTRHKGCTLLSAPSCKKDAYNMPKDSMCSPHNVKEPSCPCSHFKIQKDGSTTLCTDGRDYEGRQTSQAIPKSYFSGLQAKDADFCGDKNYFYSKADGKHVTTSSKPLNFLEAAKQALKSSSSPMNERGTEGKNASPPKGVSESSHVNQFQKSFAHVVKQSQESTTRQVSQAFVSSSFLNEMHDMDMEKNGGTRVIVPTEILNRRIESCKLSIIGRVVLAKGEEAWSSKKLRERLNEVWNFNSSWRLISLGKGYFHVLLTSQEEFEKVWTRGVVNVKPGVMRFQKWIFGFDPLKEKTSNAQVWFRFYNLPWCLWDSSILTALSRKIGSPIRFDNNTIHGDFGHYARVLIEVDLSKEIKTVLQLDCGRDVFDVKVVPENIPSFCKACSNIGHQSSECRTIRRSVETTKATKDLNDVKTKMDNQDRMDGHQNKGKGLQESVKGNQKDKSIEEVVPVQTSNKFAALEEYEDRETGKESNGIQNSDIEEAKGDDQVQNVPLSKEDVHHTLKGIRMWAEQEKRKITQPVENSGKLGEKEVRESPTPKTPKRWSDIQDEEDEKEAEEANTNFQLPQSDDVLSFERNGELTEIFMRNGKIRFTPISDKSKN